MKLLHPIPLPPAPGNHLSASCVYTFTYSGYFNMNGIIQDMTFCVCSCHLSMTILRFIHTEAWISTSFLFMAKYYFIVWIDHSLFMHSFTDEPLGCFHFFVIVNSAAMSIRVQGFEYLFPILFGIYPQVEELPVFENKFYWSIATPIHLYIVYGFFHATMAELNSYNRENMATKPQIFTIYPLIEKVCRPLG